MTMSRFMVHRTGRFPGAVTGIMIMAVLISTGCHSRKNPVNSPLEQASVKTDTTFIFNGTTLDGWEVTNFGPQGPVYISGGEIILGMGDGCTGITYRKPFPEVDYKVTIEAKRVSGNDFFCGLTFPVETSYCSLIVGGWGGTTVGLSSINGMDASENETTSLMSFETNRWYRICLTVKKDTLKALIDDVPVVNFAIDGKKLSIRPEVNLSRPFGIASWRTTAAIRNIRVERI